MLNFLYCFDNNYNIQASVSIYSLLEKVSEKISIYIIHKDKHFKDHINVNIRTHPNLKELNVYTFKELITDFPNLDNNHISEATYYRLFVSNYLPKSLNNIVYLDADVVCLNNPVDEIKHIQKMMKDKYSVGVKTELLRKQETESLFYNLEMKNQKYFNAGVMVIDLNLWKKLNIEQLAQSKMVSMASIIRFWDQDILNSIIDSDFLEISNNLNFIVNLASDEDILNGKKMNINQSIFLHYAGSNKPWEFNGIMNYNSTYYQRIFREINYEKYHLEVKWRKFMLKQLIENIKNFKVFRIEFSMSLIILALKKLIKH